MQKTKFWTIWDKENDDYGFSIFMEVPVFKRKKDCAEVVKMWNAQAEKEGKPRKYKVIETGLKRDAAGCHHTLQIGGVCNDCGKICEKV